MQKLLGHNAALRGWSLQLGLRIRRNGAKPPYQIAVLDSAEMPTLRSKFQVAMVNLA